MAYGDFKTQVLQRGASGVVRSSETKTMTFAYQGQQWRCVEPSVRTMTNELADGYEMAYCLARYCQKIDG